MGLIDRFQPYNKHHPQDARIIEQQIAELTGLLGRRDVVIQGAAWRTSDPSVSNPIDHDQLRSVSLAKPGTVRPDEHIAVEAHHQAPLAMASNYWLQQSVVEYTDVVAASPYIGIDVAKRYLAQKGHTRQEIRYGTRVLKRIRRESRQV